LIRNRHLPADAFSTFATLVCFATFLIGLIWVIADARGFAPIADFKCFYAAGRIVAEGRGPELYVPSVQEQMLQRVIPGHTKYFFNPPAFVLPFVPLSQLPLMTAYWLWTALSLVALFSGLRILLRLSGLPPPQQLLLAAAALAFEPTYQNLRWGNVSAFVLLLVALFFCDLLVGKERRAGVWLALLMVKPELFLIPAIVLAAKRKWRCIESYLASGVVLLIVSWGVVGGQGFVRYVAMNFQALHGNTPVYTEARLRELLNWRSLFVRLLGGGPWAEGLALAFTVLSGVILYLVWRGDYPTGSWGYRSRWALTLLFSILMAPHLHIQSLIIAVAAASLLLGGQGLELAAQTQRLLPQLALTAVALSWLPELNLLWGLTAIQVALIAAVFPLSRSLLAHSREDAL
jgi:hypothetical protein